MELIRQNEVFVLRCTYHERDTPKQAGFKWHGLCPANPCPLCEGDLERAWYTMNPRIAHELRDYAGDKLRAHLEDEIAKRQVVYDRTFAQSTATDSAIEIPAPAGLAYLPFQRAGIEFASQHRGVLLADEMGLGKTIQAAGLINYMNPPRVLIVCPASLKLNWKRELDDWLVTGQSIGIADDAFPASDIVIINYERLQRYRQHTNRRWDLLVVDECHKVKNPKTIRAKEVYSLQAERRLFLTGTPILNRPVEVQPIAAALAPEEFGDFWAFAYRYCDLKFDKGRADFSGASHLEELNRRLRSTIMVRRLKEDVLTELPPKRRRLLAFPVDGFADALGEEQREWIKCRTTVEALQLAVECAKATGSHEEYKEAVRALRKGVLLAFHRISVVRHRTALAKVPLVVARAREILEETSKVVIFAHHLDVIDRIARKFTNAVKLTGEHARAEQDAAVQAFQTDDACRVFVGSFMAAGLGHTLTRASTVLFAELDWTPANISQAEDRCHRIGQRDTVLVEHLVLNGSIDAWMAKMLIHKQEIIDAAINGGKQPVTKPIPPLALFGTPTTREASFQRITKVAGLIAPHQLAPLAESLLLLDLYQQQKWAEHLSDPCGFSRVDRRLGERLLAKKESWTSRHAAMALVLVYRYRRQLPDELVEAAVGSIPVRLIRTTHAP